MKLEALRGRWRRSLAREIQRARKSDLDIDAINLALAVVDRRLVSKGDDARNSGAQG